MEDPGFLSGLIGWVIGFAMGLIVEQIKIALSFPEQLQKLEKMGENYASLCAHNSVCPRDLRKILQEVSEMVKSGQAVLPFDFISRYVMCRKMSTLISEVDKMMTLYILIEAVRSWMKQALAKDNISAEENGEFHVSLPAGEDQKVVLTNFLSPAMQKFQYTTNQVVATTVGEVTTMPVMSVPSEEGEKLAEEVDLPMHEVQEGVPSTNGGSLCIDIPVTAAPTTMAALATPAVEEEMPAEAAIYVEEEMPVEEAICAEKGIPTEVAISAEKEMTAEAAISPEKKMRAEAVISAEKLEKPEEQEVGSRNRGFFSRFMAMLPLKWIAEHTKGEQEGTKQLECLEDVVQRIRPTITIIKERLISTSDSNASVVKAWIEQLEQLLGDADKTTTQFKGSFISHRKARKIISGLISEINALLKWGIVLI